MAGALPYESNGYPQSRGTDVRFTGMGDRRRMRKQGVGNMGVHTRLKNGPGGRRKQS